MTLIIGILCSDGIVVGADGAATYTTSLGQIRTITQPTPKLRIIGEQVILGLSGPLGLGQSYVEEIEPQVRNRNYLCPWKTVPEARKFLQENLWKHAELSWKRAEIVSKTVGQHAMVECLHQTIVAFPIGDNPHLLQLNHQCHPEEATSNLPFIAIGSGQPTADPFLAFIRRTFWPNSPPALTDGIFAVAWALDYSIKAQPGGISDPKQIIILEKENGKWKANQLTQDELGEHMQMITTINGEFPAFVKRITSGPPSLPAAAVPSFSPKQ